MSFCDECETNWIFGAAGECVRDAVENDTFFCECDDEDLTGVDYFFDTKDCTVSIRHRTLIHTLGVVFGSLALLQLQVATHFTFKLYLKLRKRSKQLVDGVGYRDLRVYLFTFLEAFFTCISVALKVAEDIYFLSQPEKFEELNVTPGLLVMISLNSAILRLGGCALTLAWYYSLPDPVIYGELLGLNSCIINYPQLPFIFMGTVVTLTTLDVLIGTTVSQFDLFNLPPDQYFAIANYLGAASQATLLIFQVGFGLTLINLLNKVLGNENEKTTHDFKREVKYTKLVAQVLLSIFIIYVLLILPIRISLSVIGRYFYFGRFLQAMLFYIAQSPFHAIVISAAANGRNPFKVKRIQTQVTRHGPTVTSTPK